MTPASTASDFGRGLGYFGESAPESEALTAHAHSSPTKPAVCRRVKTLPCFGTEDTTLLYALITPSIQLTRNQADLTHLGAIRIFHDFRRVKLAFFFIPFGVIPRLLRHRLFQRPVSHCVRVLPKNCSARFAAGGSSRWNSGMIPELPCHKPRANEPCNERWCLSRST